MAIILYLLTVIFLSADSAHQQKNVFSKDDKSILLASSPETNFSDKDVTSLSDVLQSLAISERPKVKPISKKDGKYILKKSTLTTVLQKPVSYFSNF